MRNSSGIKGILIKKLGSTIKAQVSLIQFNEAFLFLDSYNKVHKIMPYGLFEKNFELESIKRTDSGSIFYTWLNSKTGNIEKDFNKSRKLVRLFRDIVTEYDVDLVYNLAMSDIFSVSLVAFFTDYDCGSLPFAIQISDEESLSKTLIKIRQYLASIFFLDLLKDSQELEQVLDLFINGNQINLVEELIKEGVRYLNEV